MSVDGIYVRMCGSTDYFTTLRACTHVHCSTHSSIQMAYQSPLQSPSSNYTHCSQLLLIHRMVAYSNLSPVENKMATRAMLIRDAFMLPAELTAITYEAGQHIMYMWYKIYLSDQTVDV